LSERSKSRQRHLAYVRLGVLEYPSSKRCSDCGYTVAKMPLNVRSWTCPECGSIHDRDINAERNVLAAGLAVSIHAEAVSPVSL